MFLRDIGVGLPARKITSDQIALWTESDPAFIATKVGITERRILEPELSTSDLAKKAIDDLFNRNKGRLSPQDIDLLIVVTQNPDFKLPHTSAILQHMIGAKDSVAAFDISLGCSGWVYALSVAKSMMALNDFKNAVVVTSDPYSKAMAKNHKSTMTVFGDGATATWLSSESGFKIGEFSFGTDGSKYDRLIIKEGGAKNPSISFDKDALDPSQNLSDHCIQMEGRDILQFMLERVPGAVENCAAKNSLKMDEVDYFLFHQASKYMLTTLARKMSLDLERVPMNIDRLGNTVSSTIPILIQELLDQNLLKGKTALACGFGVGLSWSSTVIHF